MEHWQRSDHARQQALQMMNRPQGQKAIDGMYYTELFGWTYEQFMKGEQPSAIPTALLSEWKLLGEARKSRPKPKGQAAPVEPVGLTPLDEEIKRQFSTA